MTTRAFHLGDILSVTTSRLVSPRHMGGVYDILSWMTGESVATYQIPRVTGECVGPLLAQHPDLAGVRVPGGFGDGTPESAKRDVDSWLAGMVAVYGETREVAPLGPDEHARIDPAAELRRTAPQARVIAVIIVPGGEGGGSCPQ